MSSLEGRQSNGWKPWTGLMLVNICTSERVEDIYQVAFAHFDGTLRTMADEFNTKSDSAFTARLHSD
jgi:hypothetical protein